MKSADCVSVDSQNSVVRAIVHSLGAVTGLPFLAALPRRSRGRAAVRADAAAVIRIYYYNPLTNIVD